MRFAGLLVLTGVIACAIAIVPTVRWAFVAIAMLPAAFYGRSVINADGSALAAAIMVTALWLRGAICPQRLAPGWQSLWMVLNALTKAPNVTFVLLELRLLTEQRGWRRLALVVLPAIAAAAAWTLQQRRRYGKLADGRDHGPEPGRIRSVRKALPHDRASIALPFGRAWRPGCEKRRRAVATDDRGPRPVRYGVAGWVYPAVSALVLGYLFRSAVALAVRPLANSSFPRQSPRSLTSRRLPHFIYGLHAVRCEQRVGRARPVLHPDPSARRDHARVVGQSRFRANAQLRRLRSPHPSCLAARAWRRS